MWGVSVFSELNTLSTFYERGFCMIQASSRNIAKLAFRVFLAVAALIIVAVFVWQGITASGAPDPTLPHTDTRAAIINTGILVFREGLECILVISAVVASMMGSNQKYRRPIAIGVAIGFVATIETCFVAVGIVSDLSKSIGLAGFHYIIARRKNCSKTHITRRLQ